MAETDQSLLSLGWELHESSMKTSVNSSQQNEEFVDLTIAADGHLVKVHKLILAIASPYIKSLIQSAACCDHPVIYLNNVSYPILTGLMEYVYTGQVAIAEDNLETFLSVAKSLQIRGLIDVDVISSDVYKLNENIINNKRKDPDDFQDSCNKIINNDTPPTNVSLNNDGDLNDLLQSNLCDTETIDTLRLTEDPNNANVVPDEDIIETEVINLTSPTETTATITSDTLNSDIIKNQELQYTVSSRGSLQLILNRYMYNLFSRSNNGQIRRWRCVEYRDRKCQACAVTEGNVVLKRISMHIHPFHDKKILSKKKKAAVYSTIKALDQHLNR